MKEFASGKVDQYGYKTLALQQTAEKLLRGTRELGNVVAIYGAKDGYIKSKDDSTRGPSPSLHSNFTSSECVE